MMEGIVDTSKSFECFDALLLKLRWRPIREVLLQSVHMATE